MLKPAAARALPTRYEVRHETVYSYSEAVPVCHNEIHLVPRDLPHQRLLANQLVVEPEPAVLSSRPDRFGNRVGVFAIEAGHRRLVIASTSVVEIDPPRDWREFEPLPWETLRERLTRDTDAATLEARQFACESPLVPISPRLASWAAESFTPSRPWHEALVELTSRIHGEFAYDPTATTTSTPVEEVFALKRGVCQDFAHLQIACLRSLGLAARYVSGYISNERPPGSSGPAGMVGADASHAWLACWGGSDGWLDVDPTNDCPAGSQHVTIGWGRDYADVAPVKGVCIGGGTHAMEVAVHVSRLG
ncbi:MAG: transglutaminase N-terminal domain-containing protein [Planctomycetota bacterium]